LADSQRQITSESSRARQSQSGEAGKDALRRLAGEQERLADRLGRVQDGLKQQGPAGTRDAKDGADAKALQRAATGAARDIERQRLGERMQQSADAMRAGAGGTDSKSSAARQPAAASPDGGQSQEDIARALDRLADTLAAADRPGDDESRKVSGQLARAQELRERLDDLSRQVGELGQQAGNNPQNGAQPGGRSGQSQNSQPSQSASPSAPGDTGKPGQGQVGSGGSGADIARLRDELNREIQQVRELLEQIRREEGTQARGGAGFTFEGQGMTLSAPGTEAFKQDFAKWQELKRQATLALEQAESTLAKKLQARNAKDRLAAGADDKPPAAYQQQVDSYFKALATRKKP
jgi:hypothetical protein